MTTMMEKKEEEEERHEGSIITDKPVGSTKQIIQSPSVKSATPAAPAALAALAYPVLLAHRIGGDGAA